MINAKSRTVTKTWEHGDRGFYFSPDNISLIPRAALMISNSTPYEYRLILEECLRKKYVIPIAYQPFEEIFLEELTK